MEDNRCFSCRRYTLRDLLHDVWQFLLSVFQHFICCSKGIENKHHEPTPTELKPEASVLVVGASDTGKSTFMKQIRLEFGDGYPVSERRGFIPDIRRNVLGCVQKLVTAVDNYDFEYACQDTKDIAKKFKDWSKLEVLAEAEIIEDIWAEDIEILWKDPVIQDAYKRGNEYHLMTNAEHFITGAKRILTEDYIPSFDDILRMRLVTRSPFTKTYELSKIIMTLHDMGGQRPERSDWIQQLNEPSAILFLASLSEYDQTVEEAEEPRNRVEESLDVFRDLLRYSPFENTPVILLLNKSDVFSVKIRARSLRTFFPDYTGTEGCEEEGRNFITGLYEQESTRYNRNLLVRYTEATNKDNFLAIFAFVSAYVSRSVIGVGGLY